MRIRRLFLVWILMVGCTESGPPQKAQRLFLEALDWQQKGKLSMAENLYKQAIGIDSTFYEAHHNLAMVYANKSDTVSALEAFDRTFRHKPGYYLGLLNAWYWAGEWQLHSKRLVIAESLLQYYPDSTQWISFKAEVLLDLGRYSECLTILEKDTVLLAHSYELQNHRGVALYNLKQYAGALRAFNTSDSLKPNQFATVLNKALTFLAMGDFQSARHYLRRVDQNNKSEPLYIHVQYFIKTLLSDVEPVEGDATLPEITDKKLWAMINRTKAFQLFKLNRYREALHLCDKALEADSSIQFVYYLKALTHQALGETHSYQSAKEQACQRKEWDACVANLKIWRP